MLEEVMSLGEEVEFPYSREGEEGLIGCLLLDQERIDEVMSVIAPTDFYDLRLGNIFSAILQLKENGKPIDAISLAAESKPELAALGGVAELSRLMDTVPSSLNLPYYLGLVSEKSRARALIQTARKVILKMQRDSSEESVGECEQMIQDFSTTHSTPNSGEVGIKEAVLAAIDNMEALVNSDGSVVGLPTGFPALDRMTSGMREGDYWVLAARPSVGKTSLAMNIVEHLAIEKGVPVGVLSMEMTASSLAERMIAGKARVNTRFIVKGDMAKLVSAAGKIASAPIHIDQSASLSAEGMRARAKRMASVYGIKALVVDYLQLGHAKADSRVQEVSKISSTLKTIAKELGIPVLCLSQLNRGVEQTDRKPKLSDLRDSGAIEQDADLVALLHRPNSSESKSSPIFMELDIAKQRNGPIGIIEMDFFPDETRFTQHLPGIHEMD